MGGVRFWADWIKNVCELFPKLLERWAAGQLPSPLHSSPKASYYREQREKVGNLGLVGGQTERMAKIHTHLTGKNAEKGQGEWILYPENPKSYTIQFPQSTKSNPNSTSKAISHNPNPIHYTTQSKSKTRERDRDIRRSQQRRDRVRKVTEQRIRTQRSRDRAESKHQTIRITLTLVWGAEAENGRSTGRQANE